LKDVEGRDEEVGLGVDVGLCEYEGPDEIEGSLERVGMPLGTYVGRTEGFGI